MDKGEIIILCCVGALLIIAIVGAVWEHRHDRYKHFKSTLF